MAERQALYRQVASAYLADRPYLILFHMTWLWAHTDRLQGFTPSPDGLLRMPGLRMQ
jgi:peptide/nickel transport system substrate-binding protein